MEQIQLNTANILSLFDTTKEQRSLFVNDLVERIANGEINALNAHIQVKCMESIIKEINSAPEYKDAVLNEAEKYGAKSFEFGNAKFQVKETGVKYDYSMCGDPKWEMLNSQIDDLKEKIKINEEELKHLPIEGRAMINKSTGEVYEVFPPSKISTTSVAVTLK